MIDVDWIDRFLELTDSVRSPRIFRLWAAISCIAGICGRKLYTETDVKPLAPNIFVVLVGLPASGKSNSVNIARRMLAGIPDLKLAPDNPSPASFMDALADTTQFINGSAVAQSSLNILCREFGVLIPQYDPTFLASMTDLYDNVEKFTMPRRTSKSLSIDNPSINMLAGATPAALSAFPDSAWNEGFTSRLFLIYSDPLNAYRDPFKRPPQTDLDSLHQQLAEWHKELHGEFFWEPDAMVALKTWLNDDLLAPIPDYPRLFHYCGRRNEHAMKLSMISAVSAGNGLNVTIEDFERARQWLLSAEKYMPSAFRAMAVKSDLQILQEAHHFFWHAYNNVDTTKRQAFQEIDVFRYFEARTTADRIRYMIQLMLKTERLKRTGFGYVPGPMNPNQDII